eukprot:scaffold75639_cov36-Prasinocladus_malaysianus.AAC.1
MHLSYAILAMHNKELSNTSFGYIDAADSLNITVYGNSQHFTSMIYNVTDLPQHVSLEVLLNRYLRVARYIRNATYEDGDICIIAHAR